MRAKKIDSTPRRRMPAVTSVTVEHTRSTGKQLTYTISADRRGNYSIALGDRVLSRHGNPLAGFGSNIYGSKRLQEEAIEAAKHVIARKIAEEG